MYSLSIKINGTWHVSSFSLDEELIKREEAEAKKQGYETKIEIT